MNATGRDQITVQSLYEVLSVAKTRNKYVRKHSFVSISINGLVFAQTNFCCLIIRYTIYSTVMSASHPELMKTWIRNSSELLTAPSTGSTKRPGTSDGTKAVSEFSLAVTLFISITYTVLL